MLPSTDFSQSCRHYLAEHVEKADLDEVEVGAGVVAKHDVVLMVDHQEEVLVPHREQ